MNAEKKEPRWSVTYTIHLDDKNGKTWGTLYFPSSAHPTKSDVVDVFAKLAKDFASTVARGSEGYMFLFLPSYVEGLTEDSDFGVFVGVTAFSFSVTDLWENIADE